MNTRIEINPRIYEQFPNINKNWMPIEQKIVEIQIGSNLFHITTKIQFPIQVVIEGIFIIRVPKRMV